MLVILANGAAVALRRVLIVVVTLVGLAMTAGRTPRYILRLVTVIEVVLPTAPGTITLVAIRLMVPAIDVVEAIRSGELPPAVTVDVVPIADGVGAVTRATEP
jgi:hypothetical protein